MTYRDISEDGQSWINDLMENSTETGFPGGIYPADMTPEDRDALADYLRAEDPSLSEADNAFSGRIGDEIAALEEDEEEDHSAEVAEFVGSYEDDDDIPQRELERVFVLAYGRAADDSDRETGLWSLICAAAKSGDSR